MNSMRFSLMILTEVLNWSAPERTSGASLSVDIAKLHFGWLVGSAGLPNAYRFNWADNSQAYFGFSPLSPSKKKRDLY